MAFMLAENQASFSDESQKREAAIGSVSSHLLLKSSRQSLDKDAVLRRLRHHKTMTRVKNAVSAAVIAATARLDESDDLWLQRGDAFTFP
ncbi:hypothetical protein AAHA92_27609 [Salvia divinorum]|uniref:Uncharacterized protein n=1 Tax=Salvia divinorum TaxID=28513 RepID=A0ABD1G4W2_SALDI